MYIPFGAHCQPGPSGTTKLAKKEAATKPAAEKKAAVTKVRLMMFFCHCFSVLFTGVPEGEARQECSRREFYRKEDGWQTKGIHQGCCIQEGRRPKEDSCSQDEGEHC